MTLSTLSNARATLALASAERQGAGLEGGTSIRCNPSCCIRRQLVRAALRRWPYRAHSLAPPSNGLCFIMRRWVSGGVPPQVFAGTEIRARALLRANAWFFSRCVLSAWALGSLRLYESFPMRRHTRDRNH